MVISEGLVEWASTAAEARGVSVSALVREALERELVRSREQELTEAAELLAGLYRADKELTALTALDGEDFA